MGVDATWCVIGADEKPIRTNNVEQWPNFPTLKEAQQHCTENNYEVISTTEVTYNHSGSKLYVYIGEQCDAEYSDVRSKKSIKSLLMEDYGIEVV